MVANVRLDHAVINVGFRMDVAQALFTNLGFKLTPRGFHSTGSINHLAMFGADYLELIGLPKWGTHERPDIANAPAGVNGIVFKTDDVNATYTHLQNANFHSEGPKSFSRPVNLDNGTYQAKFQTVTVRSEIFAGGRVYFCEHGTPELIWRPEWQSHSNGAGTISEIIVVSSTPNTEADNFAKLLNGENIVGKIAFDGGNITVVSQTQYSERYEALASSMKNRDSIFGCLVLQTNNRGYLNEMLDNGIEGLETQIEKLRTLVRIPAFDALIEFID